MPDSAILSFDDWMKEGEEEDRRLAATQQQKQADGFLSRIFDSGRAEYGPQMDRPEAREHLESLEKQGRLVRIPGTSGLAGGKHDETWGETAGKIALAGGVGLGLGAATAAFPALALPLAVVGGGLLAAEGGKAVGGYKGGDVGGEVNLSDLVALGVGAKTGKVGYGLGKAGTAPFVKPPNKVIPPREDATVLPESPTPPPPPPPPAAPRRGTPLEPEPLPQGMDAFAQARFRHEKYLRDLEARRRADTEAFRADRAAAKEESSARVRRESNDEHVFQDRLYRESQHDAAVKRQAEELELARARREAEKPPTVDAGILQPELPLGLPAGSEQRLLGPGTRLDRAYMELAGAAEGHGSDDVIALPSSIKDPGVRIDRIDRIMRRAKNELEAGRVEDLLKQSEGADRGTPFSEIFPKRTARGADQGAKAAEQYSAYKESVGERRLPFSRAIELDPTTLNVDAATYQYKGGGNERGVTGKLSNLRRANFKPLDWEASTIVVHERADGSRFVVDGHQRTDYATRMTQETGERFPIRAIVLKEADGWTTGDVRAVAAGKNIRDGSGTAVDAAKILRENPHFDLGSLPSQGAMVRDAVGLAKLSDQAFQEVAAGGLKESFGSRLGELVPDKKLHAELVGQLQKLNPRNEMEAVSYIQNLQRFGIEEAPDAGQGMLFGTKLGNPLVIFRTELESRLLGDLMRARRIMSGAARGDSTLRGVGYETKPEIAKAEALEARRLEEWITQQAGLNGPIADSLTAGARRLASGEKIDGVAADVLSVVRAVAEGKEPAAGLGGGGGAANEPLRVRPSAGGPGEEGLTAALDELQGGLFSGEAPSPSGAATLLDSIATSAKKPTRRRRK